MSFCTHDVRPIKVTSLLLQTLLPLDSLKVLQSSAEFRCQKWAERERKRRLEVFLDNVGSTSK